MRDASTVPAAESVTRIRMGGLWIMTHARTVGITLYGITAILLCVPMVAQAEAADPFAGRLDEAIRRVEAARDHGAPLGDLAALFPETEEMSGPAGTIRVEHTSLWEEWKAVPAEGKARRESLERLRDRLAAVRAQVTSGGGVSGVGAAAPAGWREKLTQVLRRPEFMKGQTEEDWRVRLMQWLRDKLGFLFPGGTARTVGSALRWIIYALAGVTLCGVLFVLVRAALPLLSRDRRTPQELPSSAPAGVETEESLLALADARRRAGDLRGATQAVFGWMLLGLQRAGRLEDDPALTNREHLGRLKAGDSIHTAFERLSGQFELAWYGFHPMAPEEFAAFRSECQRVAGGPR